MNKRSHRALILIHLLVTLCCFGLNTGAQRADQTKHPYASTNPISEPSIFGKGVISTGDFDSHPAFTPDGKTLYFLRSTPNFNFWTILISRFERGTWSMPEVAPFSGLYSDADPFVTSDGTRFYFISNRPVTGKQKQDLDIWVIEKEGAGDLQALVTGDETWTVE